MAGRANARLELFSNKKKCGDACFLDACFLDTIPVGFDLNLNFYGGSTGRKKANGKKGKNPNT